MNQDLAQHIFVGDSEMARRMRAMDWGATAFGPLAQWPQSLRTAASICIASRLPMIVWWGPTLSVVYNDAYIPIFQQKHPSVLGRTGVEAWGEGWDVIGPMLERVMNDGGAAWSEDQSLELRRRGFPEEAYFTWSHSPIRDESGKAAGVFTAIMETTDRVLSVRRLLTLRDLNGQDDTAMGVDATCDAAIATLARNTADFPFAIVYLLDADRRSARLVSRSAAVAAAACVPVMALRPDAEPWPLSAVIESRAPLTIDVPAQFGELYGERWPEPVRVVRLLPIIGASDRVVGVLVAGVSPRLDLDDSYTGTLDLVGRSLTAAIAAASLREQERHRAESPGEHDRANTAFFGARENAAAHTADAARAESALREHRDVLALAMRGGRMGAWSRNLATNDVWWSRELEELFGLEPGGFAGTTDGFHAFVHEDDRQSLVDAVAHAVQTRTDYLLEFRYRHASGQWRWMEGRGRATYAADGSPVMLYGLGIDLTERKTAEDAVEQARNAAETANRLKDQFLATLSHELRTPLNAILGYARMLRTNAIAEGKRERAIEIIERNAVAQNQLVEDLLDVSRITTGKVRLELESLPAARGVLEAVEAVRPTADAKRIALDVDVDPLAGTVIGDGTRLQQVFRNLLSNAVKFTNDGGTVGVLVKAFGARTVIVVSDNGIGIAPKFLPHVFDLFRQADARFSREHGGLGLGLAICKQLVELHGGTITADSAGVGRGSTFTVSLPNHPIAQLLSGDGAANAPVAAPAAADEVLPAALEGMDILIVDGEADTLELFRELLEGARAVVRTASDGPAALAEFARRPPGVLIAHLGLPGMDGYALIEQVRARAAKDGGTATAIAVTAFARLDDRAKALAAGFDAHLSKPIVPGLFVASVAAAARQKARV